MFTPRLLYVDDTQADIELLRTLLTPQNIRVDAARTGKAGVESYDPDRHAAIVIDWNLPDMPGLAVARALRARHPNCRIAFLSGLFEPEHILGAAALGIHECFEKKIDMSHIVRIGRFVRADAAGQPAADFSIAIAPRKG